MSMTEALIASKVAGDAAHARRLAEGQNRLVYISGAITGATPDEIALFGQAATELRSRGFRVFNPPEHDIPEAATKQHGWTFALCRDIRVITHCYGIAVLGTFERSKGACLEVFNAISLQKEIVLLDGQPDAWRAVIVEQMRWVQATLWKEVDRSRFTHHDDIPGRP